jgi:hypothetical protein
MKTRIASFVVLIVLAAIGIACAAEVAATVPVTTAAPAALATFLKDTVFPVIGSLLMGFLAVLIKKIADKFHIDALAQKDNFLTQLAFQGITMAEEKAAQLVGSRAALTGNEKMDAAIAHILSVMPKISPERARVAVEATLAQIPGIGATGAQSFQLGSIFTALAATPQQEAPAPAPLTAV